MSRIGALELAFFGMDTPSRPFHMAAVLLFDPPEGGTPGEMVERTVEAFRGAKPVAPWDKRPVLGLGSLPRWETVEEIDIDHHVRHVALPSPGSRKQLMEFVAQLNPSLLDRSRPLWEATVIEGLENGQMAVYLKMHHALADGVGGIGMLQAALSKVPDDDPQPVWAVSPQRSSGDRGEGHARTSVEQVVKRIARRAVGAPGMARVVPGALRFALRGTSPPFSAPVPPTLTARISPARSFAILDLPLTEVKAIGKRFGGTVNDVLLSVFYDAIHRYLSEAGALPRAPLVGAMPMSTRREGDHSTSNAVTSALVRLGEPEATPAERLDAVVKATARVKSEMRHAPSSVLQLQAMSVLAALELRERLPVGRSAVPHVANFMVSNVPGGPRHELFLGRARLAGMYATPIVAPSQAANFTVVAYDDALCVGIGAARSLVPDTERLAELALRSFADLRRGAGPPARS